MQRKNLARPAQILFRHTRKVWDETRCKCMANQGVHRWYLFFRQEAAYLFAENEYGPNGLNDTEFSDYIERLLIFTMMLMQFDGIVLRLPKDIDEMADAAEDLSAEM